ncbi:MAG TPA: hypothetical protein VGN57_06255 [Pirellulaceae bacterium]|jgi:hypothetical protein|nr:hypothetical protein [Pirellulaceae bacterium]
MKPLPRTENALLVRTNFASDEAWMALRGTIEEPTPREGVRAYVDFLSDPQYDGAGSDALVKLSPGDSTFFLVADDATFAEEERPVLVVNLFSDPSLDDDPYFANRGDSFRAVATVLWSVENNLSLGNMGFEEFVAALDAGGVFRGFPET